MIDPVMEKKRELNLRNESLLILVTLVEPNFSYVLLRGLEFGYVLK